jgi:NhaP-type Na+/H+ or K+/H+ antiporter
MPPRLVTILEGESLVNDGALTLDLGHLVYMVMPHSAA